MRRRFHQREIVARRADGERFPNAQVVMHTARAAAARGVALDCNGIALRIGLGVEQRILRDQSVRLMHIDMRAGLISGQRLAVGGRELIDIGVARREADRVQPNLDQLWRRFLGRRRRIHCGGGAHSNRLRGKKICWTASEFYRGKGSVPPHPEERAGTDFPRMYESRSASRRMRRPPCFETRAHSSPFFVALVYRRALLSMRAAKSSPWIKFTALRRAPQGDGSR